MFLLLLLLLLLLLQGLAQNNNAGTRYTDFSINLRTRAALDDINDKANASSGTGWRILIGNWYWRNTSYRL